jgi:hypothetical protein
VADGAEDGAAVRFLRIDCGAAGLGGATIAVDGLAGRAAEGLVRVAWADGRTASGVLRPGGDAFVVPGDPGGSRAAVAGGYLRLGMAHILAGADHLAFLAGLLLLVGGWRALVATVTAFTLAHSLTLAAATLAVVAPPSAPVEALIAASILLVAAELARPPGAPPTLARRRPWLVAFAFGLLHGLGFAGALAEAGLPRDHLPLALLAFNLGVEAGQLAFVAACLPALALARRVGAGRAWVRLGPAYVLGSLAAAWLLDRLSGFWRPGL